MVMNLLRADLKPLSLGFFPTPIEPLPRLSAALGGPDIWIKRDDCTGLGGGGNKTRKLEYLIAAAVAQGSDIILTAGALQSNHARQTAAAAAKTGLECALFLAASVPLSGSAYNTNGNMLLDRIFGADLHLFPPSADLADEMSRYAESKIKEGRRPFIIPIGGSNAIGALGYCEAMGELKNQCSQQELSFDRIFFGTGSGGTQAGMLVGATLYDVQSEIVGISVNAHKTDAVAKVSQIIDQTLNLLDRPSEKSREVIVDDRFVGPGYGLPTEAVVESLAMCARLEGLLLDPVYTGKAMAGLIDYIRQKRIGRGERVLFWHTGGAPALAAYPDLFAK
ncbi:D-cysteine desulfhydrase/L-cysteate sulfo-lyase [Rhizobium leguminosarum]|uniref:D-cysteine desulfhydrase/L-cysteate sulfo-lyase n=1 Tax=Rhizobium leguminosarum TaxID=384 RepID=A0AAE2SYD7_RHILE|nr:MULTISPECIES: D-cysteine desulfhydrase family protein [Rhizobium]MBB4292375.1 D-cysteine desulfhydrase/L-cysteate sulfo-lyase [Rhizobium leguminosarum]MBB4298613.1 D-cysteine desulfhydrase/L-cysteate sulfo-lyase [Rhizobium leguminosarum]MBB4310413.1 D-cysteine desulfhydrase/L-cysteate sulfo-lyase [Rhizobium leguminosarum]MBB4434675.1 D-cysteine desulfhydrase/L-cysteate sulfo-lyase [Rhizobium esperanzae]MBB4531571.1 D-cysteine desulfhydrase/L-cysteate sulfo-lyase [Rhizobium leguminosarum]